jgi:hypothetical protein
MKAIHNEHVWREIFADPSHSLLADANSSFPLAPALVQRAETLEALSDQHSLGMHRIAFIRVPEGPLLFFGQRHDYVMLQASQDPLFTDPAGNPIPKKNRMELEMYFKAGMNPDDIYVVHEVEKGSVRPGEPIPPKVVMPPPPRETVTLSHKLSRLGRLFGNWSSMPLQLGGSTLPLAGGLLAGGLALSVGMLALPTVLIGLDPLILSLSVTPGRPVQPGEPAVLHYLTGWVWNAE